MVGVTFLSSFFSNTLNSLTPRKSQSLFRCTCHLDAPKDMFLFMDMFDTSSNCGYELKDVQRRIEAREVVQLSSLSKVFPFLYFWDKDELKNSLSTFS